MFSGWRGYDCSDGQESRQEHEQLLELLLLTLTNVLFIPGIVLALYRRHFVEALVYTFTMTFSGVGCLVLFWCKKMGSSKHLGQMSGKALKHDISLVKTRSELSSHSFNVHTHVNIIGQF